MRLHEKIKEELKDAMRAKDPVRVSVVRGLLAAFVNELVAKKRKPDEKLADDEALAVIQRAVKQRKDSIEQFEKGGRKDLADNERAELPHLEKYLPKMMSREEIRPIVEAKMKELGATDKSKAGQLTGALMKDLKGKADGADVKAVVDALLS
ncbi:MAG: GatB/YqeY domain-containing protein [bacterium]|nr:GatB/YqeY domain-containing protein [bacterium]